MSGSSLDMIGLVGCPARNPDRPWRRMNGIDKCTSLCLGLAKDVWTQCVSSDVLSKQMGKQMGKQHGKAIMEVANGEVGEYLGTCVQLSVEQGRDKDNERNTLQTRTLQTIMYGIQNAKLLTHPRLGRQ